jgi:hypothetical protein
VEAQVKKEKKIIFGGAVHALISCSGGPVLHRANLFIYFLACLLLPQSYVENFKLVIIF